MRRSPFSISLALAMTAVLHAGGCASTTSRANPYAPAESALRDPLRAQELTQQALELMGKDNEKAERLLCEALGADLYHGPAHNNLGVLFLEQRRLYEAANEFEWARKLMPGIPDPRMNLAYVLESAGRTDEAIAAYRTALEVAPGHVPTIQALTRLQVVEGRADDQTAEQLALIALRGEDDSWRDWAQLQLAKDRGPRESVLSP